MKLDILAIAAHPDDVELAAAGTLIKAKQEGKRIGVVDLTRGELGTRGSADIRLAEAQAAARIMGLDARVNLQMADGFFQNTAQQQHLLIEQVRNYRPEVVLINAVSDRHPDHARAAALAKDACFLSGLRKIDTTFEGKPQQHWRPRAVYHYIQDHYHRPDLVVDISSQVEQKIEAIKAFGTQFYRPDSQEPETPISGAAYFDLLKGRWMDYGRYIGVPYGEGFTATRPLGVGQITDLL